MRSSETSVELDTHGQRFTCFSPSPSPSPSPTMHLHRRHCRSSAYLHLSASISFPGVSRHRRMSIVCWRTTASASSSSRAWSSTGGGDAIVCRDRKEGRERPGLVVESAGRPPGTAEMAGAAYEGAAKHHAGQGWELPASCVIITLVRSIDRALHFAPNPTHRQQSSYHVQLLFYIKSLCARRIVCAVIVYETPFQSMDVMFTCSPPNRYACNHYVLCPHL